MPFHLASALLMIVAITTPSVAPMSSVLPSVPVAHSAASPPPFALIELFTSEGCSSCPPADAVLADTTRAGDAGNVIALAFHVDYWDKLGWTDPYGDAAFSERQRIRAAAMGVRGLYTPQAVVNGRIEFVGSDSARWKREIQEALKVTPTVGIGVTAVLVSAKPAPRTTVEVKRDGDGLSVASINIVADVTGLQAYAKLCVALAQSNLRTEVKRGENAGRTLTHDRVVRIFRTTSVSPASSQAEFTLPLPQGCTVSDMTVVVFVEEPTSMRTLGATSVRIGGS